MARRQTRRTVSLRRSTYERALIGCVGVPMRPRVLLDCDGILSDFVGGYLQLLNQHTGLRPDREQIDQFDIGAALGLTAEQSARMKRAIGSEADMARWLDVYPGAVEGVRRLQTIADVYIVTSPWNSNPTWTHDREHWLKRHFDIPHSRVVHTSAKYLCRGDVFVDDKVSTVVHWQVEYPTSKGVVWDTPHNRKELWSGPRTSSWDALVEIVQAVRQ